MRSCQEVARLVSLSQEQELTFGQKLELKFHMMMCKPCRDFSLNIKTLRKTLKRFNEHENTNK